MSGNSPCPVPPRNRRREIGSSGRLRCFWRRLQGFWGLWDIRCGEETEKRNILPEKKGRCVICYTIFGGYVSNLRKIVGIIFRLHLRLKKRQNFSYFRNANQFKAKKSQVYQKRSSAVGIVQGTAKNRQLKTTQFRYFLAPM